MKGSASISALAAAGAVLPAATGSAQTPRMRHGGHKLKISLNAYSFNAALRPGADGAEPKMTLFDILEFCADHNFEAIDPTGYYFPGYPKPPSHRYIADFKKRAFELGLEISGTGIRNDFAVPDKAARAADVQTAKEWIEASARLGAPVLRMFAGHEEEGADRDEILKWMAEDFQTCAEFAKEYGVIIGIQNHNDFLKTADQTLQLLEMIDSDWVGVVLDTGSFRTDPYPEIAAVVPHAVNFQLKESPYGKNSPVRIDLDRFVKIVRDAGYRGYVPIETLVPDGTESEYDPLIAVPRFLADVKAAFERAG